MSAVPFSLTRAQASDRLRDVLLLGALALWMLYTRVYWVLQTAHIMAPICPFYYVTGHPCPFCGGTRSFAYMWRGDISDAVRLYPLGPLLFAGTILGMTGLSFGALTGRTWAPRLTPMQWRLLWIFVGSVVLMSWALKVFVLGN